MGERDMTLKFNDNGKFKILAIADPQDTDTPQKETIEIIENMVNRENPDLVVFLGDNIAGNWDGVNKEKTQRAVDCIVAPLQKANVPFAIVFGNHDHEGLCNEENGMVEKEAKAFILSCFQKYSNCLAIAGEDMTGYCNYNLTIKASNSDKDVFNLWFMDSNPYAAEGGYGYVQEDQTEWYIKKSNELKGENQGTPLPAFLFQHIPVPEVYNLCDEKGIYTLGAVKGQCKLYKKFYKPNEKITQGGLLEGPCSADVMHNQFQSWKEQGDIIGAFFGHDHPNDYLGVEDGISLCAVPAAGYYSYGQNHGARTIILDENDLSTFETELFHSGEILGYMVKPLYKARHGYHEYIEKGKPLQRGLIIGASALALAGASTIAIIKKTKKS